MGRCSQHWTETPKPQGWVTASPQRGYVPLAKAPSLASPHCAPHLDTHLDMMSPSFFQCRNSANGNWLLNIIFITLVVESKAGSHVMNYISFFFFFDLYVLLDFSVAQMVKNLPAMQEARIQSLGQEDPLEKGMATHSSILAWRIPWTEEPGGLQSLGSQRVRHGWANNTATTTILLQVLLGRNHLKAGQLLAVRRYILSSW